MLRLVNHKDATITSIFSPEQASQEFVVAEVNKWQQFSDYIFHGIWHIWIGFDHILFLLSLLLPAVLVLKMGKWDAASSFKAAAIDVLKIVTAFTLPHSTTLTLAALNNLFPLFQGRRWMVAFAFGLIHGFGFASVLADLGLPQSALVLALLGFNLGVEIGQLIIVAGFLPLANLLRRHWLYQRAILQVGSGLIILVALVWFIERAFNMRLVS